MKVLFLTVVLLLGPNCFSQTKPATGASLQQTRSIDQQTAATVQIQSDAPQLTPLVNLSEPDKYGMAFLSFEPDKEGLAFMVTPDGKIGTVPMTRLTDAVKAGYRPLTVADLLAILNGVSDEETKLLKGFKELSDDYNGLAARCNRLAAVSAANPVQVRQSVDENQAMRLMRFQNF